MTLKLGDDDLQLVKKVRANIKKAYENADIPVAVAKSIVVYAVRMRNKGRSVAIKRHPFKGICEISNEPLAFEDKCLDEIEPEKGYSGGIRWTCPKGNNSGRKSCGKC